MALQLNLTKHKTRSEMIRDALEAYLEQETSERDSYELGIAYFGKSGSGERSRSVTYRDRPMDFADATLLIAAEPTGLRQVISIDSDFDIYHLSGNSAVENVFRPGR